jgi:hypothetical protein
MTNDALVIDCDGHILEPPDLWETYLEPAYRDRALRIRVGADGFEQLLIDGRPSTIARPGQLGTLGGMGKQVDEARVRRERAMRGEVAPQDVRGVRPTPEQTYLRGAAFFNLFAGQGVQQAFATFFQFGVFERFPRLRVVVLESQAGWIGFLLDRADATFTGTPLGATVRLKEKPSYYFKRQCFISADPDERTIAALMPHVGEDKFFWASDYPHPDHPGSYLEELRGLVAPMTESGRRGILGENVARAYRLSVR